MLRNFNDLQNQKFDILVIGGGIYGAWTAYDAALRGFKVALVEQNDWASGTSSASSKLIHGGLRYLEHFWFSLVQKSLNERQNLRTWAPHRVRPIRFAMPVYKNDKRYRWQLKLGLCLYDYLAGSKQSTHHHCSFSAQDFKNKFPFLKSDGLVGGFSYGDCQVDDARLTLEIVNGAQQSGTVAVNHAKALSLLKNGDQVIGALIQDSESGSTVEVQASIVVSATGPWQGQALKTLKSKDDIRLTKGVHLVLPSLGQDHAVLLTARRDDRVFFLIPWYGMSLLGTTDTNYTQDADKIGVSQEDIEYLLTEANHSLSVEWEETDILGKFAGVRVLGNRAGKDPSDISRNWKITEYPQGCLTSSGGKLTTARIEAAKTVNLISNKLLSETKPCATTRPLPWCPSSDFASWLQETSHQGKALGLDQETSESITWRYGTTCSSIHKILSEKPSLASRIDPKLPFCQAEVMHAVKNEMARTLEDVTRRRIPLAILTSLSNDSLNTTTNLIAEELGWDTAKREKEKLKFLNAQSQ